MMVDLLSFVGVEGLMAELMKDLSVVDSWKLLTYCG